MTLAEVARQTGMTRATVRRLLFTLEALGYAKFDGKRFSLTPAVLDIGYAYLSSLDLALIAQLEMEALVDRTHESTSAAVLDGAEIVYVVRVPTKRIMTISLGLGSRLPAHATSMGRVLLADLSIDQLDAHLPQGPWPSFTAQTIVDRETLIIELQRCVTMGGPWSIRNSKKAFGPLQLHSVIAVGRLLLR